MTYLSPAFTLESVVNNIVFTGSNSIDIKVIGPTYRSKSGGKVGVDL